MTRRQIARQARRARPRETGIALVIALFTVATLLLAAGSALLVGQSDIRATRNYRGASEVHFVAESGIVHAMQTVNGPGILHFQNDVVNNWGTIFGTGTKTYGGMSGYNYQVAAAQDAADPTNKGRFVASANGPEGAFNRVVALVERTNIPNTAPGAVYLAQDGSTNAQFTGNNFAIDGNDHNYTGGSGPNAPIPGISTRNSGNTQEAIGSLGGAQLDNVLGLGFLAGPPTIPSIMTSGWAPSVAQVNQIAADLLARPGVVTLAGGNINGNLTVGTESSPQITYFTANTTIKANGTAQGAGIMIVDGDLTIQGNFEFKGLVLVRGRTNVEGDTTVTGNATVYGSLWTNDVNLQVGGSAIVYYSSQALTLANLVNGGQALPSPIKLNALVDCSQALGGTPGC